MYWMLQIKQFHPFQAFTLSVLNKIECFHHLYTYHFFFMNITKNHVRTSEIRWLWLIMGFYITSGLGYNSECQVQSLVTIIPFPKPAPHSCCSTGCYSPQTKLSPKINPFTDAKKKISKSVSRDKKFLLAGNHHNTACGRQISWSLFHS